MSIVPNGEEINAIGDAVDKMTDADAWILITATSDGDGDAFHVMYRNALASHTLLKYAQHAFDDYVLNEPDEDEDEDDFL